MDGLLRARQWKAVRVARRTQLGRTWWTADGGRGSTLAHDFESGTDEAAASIDAAASCGSVDRVAAKGSTTSRVLCFCQKSSARGVPSSLRARSPEAALPGSHGMKGRGSLSLMRTLVPF